jgi:opacity protein-like surface antigen
MKSIMKQTNSKSFGGPLYLTVAAALINSAFSLCAQITLPTNDKDLPPHSSPAEGAADRYTTPGPNDKFYLGFDAGIAFQRDITISNSVGDKDHVTFDPGGRFDVEAGYNFTRHWAAELEMGLALNSVQHSVVLGTDNDNWTLVELPVLVNVIYNMPLGDHWTVYVGGGAGGVFSNYQDENGNATSTDSAFAYQGEAGIKYVINNKWDVGIGCKFLGTSEHDVGSGIAFDGTTRTEYKSDGTMIQSILANCTFKF